MVTNQTCFRLKSIRTNHEPRLRRLTSAMTSTLLPGLFCLAFLAVGVSSHGRLVDPPSRSTMWRFGFRTPPNYNDNELFCGGYSVQWQRNGGKCGVCGDAWDMKRPRPNEAGGTYGKGIIVKTYRPGQIIKSTVQLTANHRGFFEFKLCPHNDPSTEVTQECLDRNPISLADGSGVKYYPAAGTGSFYIDLRLPQQLKCTQCVFQWTYTAGNNWGTCSNGSSKLGCGPQETFRGCSDVAVGGELAPTELPLPTRRRTNPPRMQTRRPTISVWKQPRRPTISTRKQPRRTTISQRKRPQRPSTTTKKTTPRQRRPIYTRPRFNKRPPTTKKPLPTYKPKQRGKKKPVPTNCRAIGVWKSVPGMAPWCDANCPRGYCPSTHCDCSPP